METDEQPSPAKKAKTNQVTRKTPKVAKTAEKADYAGLEVKQGASGKLQRPRHSGAKIRARDKGRLVREDQMNKMAKRKKRLAVLGVTAVQKRPKVKEVVVTQQKKKVAPERDGKFEDMVAAYKKKISANL